MDSQLSKSYLCAFALFVISSACTAITAYGADDNESWYSEEKAATLVGGFISGHVYEADGVTPVAGAKISAGLYASGVFVRATSQADGSYTIAGLAPGKYEASARAPSYAQEYYQNTYDWHSLTYLVISGSEELSNIDFTLEPGGTISGIVYNADGSGRLANICISASLASGAEVAMDWRATSEADGNYTIVGFPYGQYKVWAGHLEACFDNPDYREEYYQEKKSWETADIITISSEMPNTTGINFTLERPGSISGRVYQSDATTPIASAEVFAGLVEGSYWQGGKTAPDGSYTITGLPSGNYWVAAVASGYVVEFYQESYSYQQATPVAVSAPNDTPRINFTLAKAGSISGHVYEPDRATPVVGANISAMPYDFSGFGGNATTQADGSYVIGGLATGNYRVGYSPSYGRAPQYYNLQRDYARADPVSVTAPNETNGIDFILEPGGPIGGFVFQSDGKTPISNVHVDAYDGTSGHGVKTESDGSYSLQVPYGTYRVRAGIKGYGGDQRWGTEYYQEKATYKSADLVVVSSPEGVANVNFTLELAPGSISGMVTYSGSVEGSRGQIGVIALLPGEDEPVAFAEIPLTGPGSYPYTLSGLVDQTYGVVAVVPRLDWTAEGPPSPGQLLAVGFYNTPVTVSGGNAVSGIDFSLSDAQGSISGTIDYSGTAIPNPTAIPLRVVLAIQLWDNFPAFLSYGLSTQLGSYSMPSIVAGNYFLLSWLDANNNWEPDEDEPSGFYSLNGIPEWIVVKGGGHVTGVNVTLYDLGYIAWSPFLLVLTPTPEPTPQPTPTPTPTPTPPPLVVPSLSRPGLAAMAVLMLAVFAWSLWRLALRPGIR